MKKFQSFKGNCLCKWCRRAVSDDWAAAKRAACRAARREGRKILANEEGLNAPMFERKVAQSIFTDGEIRYLPVGTSVPIVRR